MSWHFLIVWCASRVIFQTLDSQHLCELSDYQSLGQLNFFCSCSFHQNEVLVSDSLPGTLFC